MEGGGEGQTRNWINYLMVWYISSHATDLAGVLQLPAWLQSEVGLREIHVPVLVVQHRLPVREQGASDHCPPNLAATLGTSGTVII